MRSEAKLPIYGRKEIVTKEVGGKIVEEVIYHTIPDFAFTDQAGEEVTPATFHGKVYIVNFFYGGCPKVCPAMQQQMLRLYERYKDDDQVKLLSITLDPAQDSVAFLKDYASKLGVESNHTWHFVTGDKGKIYVLAQKYFFLTAIEDEEEPGGIAHHPFLVLVDKAKRIRAFHDGSQHHVDSMVRKISKLRNEDRKKRFMGTLKEFYYRCTERA